MLGSLILIAGSLSDLLGRKKILWLGLLGFAGASLVCALAPNTGLLIAARALQGIAGALLVPSSLAIIIANFTGPAQAKAIGSWTAWTGISFILGPLVGGILVDSAGKYLWPGYGENSRVLRWVFERCDGKVHAKETAIGMIPDAADLDVTGLNMNASAIQQLLSVDIDGWLAEIPLIRQHFAKFGNRLPEGLTAEVNDLERRLTSAKR